jgi:hypothetical protein
MDQPEPIHLVFLLVLIISLCRIPTTNDARRRSVITQSMSTNLLSAYSIDIIYTSSDITFAEALRPMRSLL